MVYVLFRPFKKDSENDSQSSSNGKTPKSYVLRVAKMDPAEKERIQKEIWEKQMEQIRNQTSEKPEKPKLGPEGKDFLRFMLYSTPLAFLAACGTVWGIAQFNPGAPIVLIVFAVLFLFLVFTYAMGGISLMIYSMIFQPWRFIKIPEDKLPPLDDSEDNQDH